MMSLANESRELDKLTLGKAAETEEFLALLASELKQLDLSNLPAKEFGTAEFMAFVRGTGYLLKQLRSLAGPTAETLGDVHRVLRRVPLESSYFAKRSSATAVMPSMAARMVGSGSGAHSALCSDGSLAGSPLVAAQRARGTPPTQKMKLSTVLSVR